MATKPRVPAPKTEQRSEQIHIRLTPAELRRFEAFAARKSTPLGALMRQAYIEKMEREGA